MHGLENTNCWLWKDGLISSWQQDKNKVLMLLFPHVTIVYDAKKCSLFLRLESHSNIWYVYIFKTIFMECFMNLKNVKHTVT